MVRLGIGHLVVLEAVGGAVSADLVVPTVIGNRNITPWTLPLDHSPKLTMWLSRISSAALGTRQRNDTEHGGDYGGQAHGQEHSQCRIDTNCP